jgi:hypothetical protein
MSRSRSMRRITARSSRTYIAECRRGAGDVADVTAEVFVVVWRRLEEVPLAQGALRGCTACAAQRCGYVPARRGGPESLRAGVRHSAWAAHATEAGVDAGP